MSMKNPNDTIGKPTHELPACIAAKFQNLWQKFQAVLDNVVCIMKEKYCVSSYPPRSTVRTEWREGGSDRGC